MRHPLLFLAPLFMLAACGGGSGNGNAGAPANATAGPDIAAGFERPGGGFDRDRFRAFTLDFCRSSLANAPDVPPGQLDTVCDCVASRLLEENDDALRAMVRDERIGLQKNDEAAHQCMGPGGANLEGAPPPPPAAMHDAAGPDAGAGASAPGGTRARVGSLGLYLTEDDYPAAAVRNNEQGRVAFTLDVSARGRVTACRVTESSGSAALDTATCRIMQSRARYRPARNPQGVEVADRDQASVRWVLPAD